MDLFYFQFCLHLNQKIHAIVPRWFDVLNLNKLLVDFDRKLIYYKLLGDDDHMTWDN